MIKTSSIISFVIAVWIVQPFQNPTHVDQGVLIVAFAKEHLGKPYGNRAGAFDCSGFVQHCYKSIQVEIPRSSYKQSLFGRAVTEAECKAGDIIVFTGSNQSSKKAGHTGVVSHCHQDTVFFIHSSSSSGIRYDHTLSDYYKARLLGFRRIVK